MISNNAVHGWHAPPHPGSHVERATCCASPSSVGGIGGRRLKHLFVTGSSVFLVSLEFGFGYFLIICLDPIPFPRLMPPRPVGTKPDMWSTQRRFLSLGAAYPFLCGTQHNLHLHIYFFTAPLRVGCERLRSRTGPWSISLHQTQCSKALLATGEHLAGCVSGELSSE